MTLLIDVLATRRLTRLVVEDKITLPLRARIAEEADGSALDYLVNCPACASVWAAAAVLVSPRWLRYLLAISEAGILVGTVSRLVERIVL